ncbi:MAG: hypothetical protein MUE42_01710 [Opitutaceae bacterium]|jgi:N-formylglutamate amidohydrolase|nr:hypothetical protein [Opitutaceae bacterium]
MRLPASPFLLTLLAAWFAFANLARAEVFAAIEPRFGRERYIEYRPGDMPLILVAGHGGDLSPDELPDRTWGSRGTDRHTREIALATYDEIVALTGGLRPHVVICHLRRRKLDVNRPLEEAAQGNALSGQAWHEFHDFIAEARAAVIAAHGRGLLIDVHGHGHEIPRIELGYALGREELDRPDPELDQAEYVALSTLRPLARSRPELALSDLVRGPDSLGALLTRAGYPAWPSPAWPRIGDAEFYRGGYIVRVHSRAGAADAVSAVQIELPYPGMRDTEANRARLSATLAATLLHYLNNPATYAFALPGPASPFEEDDIAGCEDACAPLVSTSAPAPR